MANPWFRLWADMANDPKWRGRSITHVDQCLTISESNGDVHDAIRSGEVSGTTAAAIVKAHGYKAGAVIKEKLITAKAIGKKKVTAAIDRKPVSDKEILDWLDGYVGDLSLWVSTHVKSESGLTLREAVTIAVTCAT